MRKKLLLMAMSVVMGLGVAFAEDVASIREQLSWVKYSAVEEAFNALSKSEGYDVATNKARLAELKSILDEVDVMKLMMNDAADVATAKKVLSIQKQILFDNPSLDFDKIILGRYKLGNARGAKPTQMGTQPNNWSNQTSAPKSGFNGEIGILSNLRGELEYQQVYKPDWGTSLPDIRLHWDADRVMFSMVPKGDHHWQVFEVGVDGKNLKQVTHGSAEDLDYIDANYLPSGKILVVTNAGGHGVPCVNGNDQVGNLALFDPKTEEMRRLTFDQDANWGPVMMHNGKVMYTRWEYTDLTHYFSRFVMSMNPDGTEQKALFGSGMLFPNSTFDIQPLPNHPSRFVGIVSGHHGVVRAGRLFMYDPAVSRNTIAGMVHEFPYKGREIDPIVKDQLVQDVWPQFIKPFPIDNENFLVTAKMSPKGLWGLYLVDIYDNVTLLIENEGEGFINATPLRKTVTPPVIPDKVNLAKNEATVFIQDIYEGEGLQNVPRGTVKKLRIHTYEYVYLKSYSNHYGMGIQSGWDMKTNLGTVDVEADGSAIFKIPANTPVSIQPLDEDGCAIQWMRSWFVGMPGETVSCVGCHEDQNKIPMPKRAIASTRAPHTLEQPEGGIRPFTFDLEIQPILDRNCVACHSEGKKLDFTGGKKDKILSGSSYLALHPYIHRQGAEAGMKVMVPYEYHANVSPLVQLLKNGHYGVELTDEEWYSIYNWIDYNGPDLGQHRIDNSVFPDQYNRRIAMGKKYANGVYNDWKKQLVDYAAYLDSKPAVEPAKNEFKAPKFKKAKAKGFPAEYTAGETMDVTVAPGVTIKFVKVPAGAFVMGENRVNSNAAPAHKAEVEKSFWMSTTELTNGQIRALIPEHNSRFYDQQWKDHVTEGYVANGDEQVAIRISWDDASRYCELLSDKSGKKVMLPTETQWEWAARGGVAEDYWYGDANANFGTKENLSDVQALKMAVKGVNPQPMAPNNASWNNINWWPYATYIPKDESVDDGNMLTALPGSYEANPFGLYDMIGNVSEWTRSDYNAYGEKASASDYKVVRGGSWRTQPKNARAAARWYYYPWQAPFNVGVRLVIEE